MIIKTLTDLDKAVEDGAILQVKSLEGAWHDFSLKHHVFETVMQVIRDGRVRTLPEEEKVRCIILFRWNEYHVELTPRYGTEKENTEAFRKFLEVRCPEWARLIDAATGKVLMNYSVNYEDGADLRTSGKLYYEGGFV